MNKRKVFIISAAILFAIFIIVLFIPKETKERQDVIGPSLLEKAEGAAGEGDLLKAKQLYLQAEEFENDAGKLKKIEKAIQDLNINILFSPVVDECAMIYTVKPNDYLGKIARKFNTTVGFIKRANDLESDVIRPGQKLKLDTCKFSIVVDKSQNILLLKRNDEVIKTYTVSTGRDNTTPSGTFTIDRNKLKNPVWHKAGAIVLPDSPDNILGARWMGIEGLDNNGRKIKGYGIHGTTEPEDLGKQVTLGCIRMSNEDVEELFDIVPVGTEVTIID